VLRLENKMIELLKNGITFSKLKSKTELCSSELVKQIHRLEDNGYLIQKIFNEYDVKLKIGNTPQIPLQDNINISVSGKFKFISLADTHLGNIYENISLIKILYTYAEKQNIRYVFHLGDMIEGIVIGNQNSSRIKRLSIQEQVDFLTRNYPKSDQVNTLYILGNHDYRCVTNGIDISKIIERRRLDMHFLGYKNSKVMLGNKSVLLHHPFTMEKEHKYDNEIKDLYLKPEFDLILRGHLHNNSIYINDLGSIVVNVPACFSYPNRKYTGAYEITIKDEEIELSNLIVDNEVTLLSTIKHPLKKKELVKK